MKAVRLLAAFVLAALFTSCGSPNGTAPVEKEKAPSSTLVLLGGPLKAQVGFKNQYTGQAGAGAPIRLSERFGYFHFGDPRNPEVLLVASDPGDASYRVSCIGLTDIGYDAVLSTASPAKTIRFHKEPGKWDGLYDAERLLRAPGAPAPAPSPAAPASAAPAALSLSKGNVNVEVAWRGGARGAASASPQNDLWGFFYAADPREPLVVVKVLDFGGDAYLVFHAGLTDLPYTVTFTNTATGQKVSFEKPAGPRVFAEGNATTLKR
jgi:hypothetical protein